MDNAPNYLVGCVIQKRNSLPWWPITPLSIEEGAGCYTTWYVAQYTLKSEKILLWEDELIPKAKNQCFVWSEELFLDNFSFVVIVFLKTVQGHIIIFISLFPLFYREQCIGYVIFPLSVVFLEFFKSLTWIYSEINL